jgi:hypothetical protein
VLGAFFARQNRIAPSQVAGSVGAMHTPAEMYALQTVPFTAFKHSEYVALTCLALPHETVCRAALRQASFS